jgi:tetratricopeptide (TPR) repeat protein
MAVISAAPFAHADKKDDLYAKGTAAANTGDAITARDAFCEIAKSDPEFKDAKAQCATYTPEATKQLNRFNQNYLEGVGLMQEGKYTEAEFKFRNVKFPSPREADAKGKLAEIAKLKQDKAAADTAAKNSADQDAQMKGKLDQGIEAYNRGDFGSAKGSLGGVSGKYQGDAQSYLTKIRDYEGKMAEGAADLANKNYSGAASAFAAAVRINPSGPGDPLGQVTKANQAAMTASAPVTTPANNPPPVTKAVTKDVVKTIDVERYVAEGQKALQKGDFKKARRYFQEVLGQDSHNQEATNGMAELKTKDTAQAAATDEDPLLAKLIRGFYEGNYNDVESLLNNYIYSGQGKKVGLANFYAGASMLTRYYLAGATDENLRREARKKFKAAKEVEGFKAPEKFISPKIMKAFQEAS